MARKFNLFIFAALAAGYMLLSASIAGAVDRGDTLDKGLRNNMPYANALYLKSEQVMGAEKVKLLEEALVYAPDSPMFHFKLAAAKLPDFGQSATHLVDGMKAYGSSFWWELSAKGLGVVALFVSFLLSMAVIAMVRLPMEMSRLVHDINESKAKIIFLFILIPAAMLGPVVLLGAVMLLTGLYMSKPDKWIVYLMLIFIAGFPVFSQMLDAFYTASSPETRAMVDVNEGRDNSYALKVLKGHDEFALRFSYATALKREGNPLEAIDLFSPLISQTPDSRAYVNLGNAYFAADRNDLAKQAYEKSLNMNKTVLGLYNLSQTYRNSFDYAMGDKYYEEAQSLDRQVLSEFLEIHGKSYNRTVIDARLSSSEIMQAAQKQRRHAFPLIVGDYKQISIAGVALLVLFVLLDSTIKNRSYRCSKCGVIACRRCSDPRQQNDPMCSDCVSSLGADEDTSAKARLARMLSANEEKSRMINRLRLLSIAPPGIAQAYSGRVGKAFIFMMFFMFPLALLVMNPYFTTGLSGGSHSWLWFVALPVIVIDYFISFITANRRLDRGWL